MIQKKPEDSESRTISILKSISQEKVSNPEQEDEESDPEASLIDEKAESVLFELAEKRVKAKIAMIDSGVVEKIEEGHAKDEMKKEQKEESRIRFEQESLNQLKTQNKKRKREEQQEEEEGREAKKQKNE